MDELKKALTGAVEALLFAAGNPMQTAELAEIMEVDDETVNAVLANLAASLSERGSGLILREVAGGWQLSTHPEHFAYIEKMARAAEQKLSNAAMETLSIVAFRQPITKQEIEDIRGVHIERMLAQLVSRGLVAEVGRKAAVGRPILYGTTAEFLRAFGLKSIDELPPLPELLPSERSEQLLGGEGYAEALLGEDGAIAEDEIRSENIDGAIQNAESDDMDDNEEIQLGKEE